VPASKPRPPSFLHTPLVYPIAEEEEEGGAREEGFSLDTPDSESVTFPNFLKHPRISHTASYPLQHLLQSALLLQEAALLPLGLLADLRRLLLQGQQALLSSNNKINNNNNNMHLA